MIAFLNGRINLENKYSADLHSLAKSGGVSMGQSYSINEYKNHEEQTLRDAINSLINFTI